MGSDVQIAFTKGHEARDMQDTVKSKVMKLDTVQTKELRQKCMDGGGGEAPSLGGCRIKHIRQPGEEELPRRPGPAMDSRLEEG